MQRSLVAALALAAALPAFAQDCTPFTDVPAADPFCASIQWMYNRGITLGCTATQYCPTQFVRRDQMAAFMSRLGNVTFQQGGNAFGATAVLGTTDARALDVVVNGARALRVAYVAPGAQGGATEGVNVTGGDAANVVARTCTGPVCALSDPVRGGTIAGGGAGSVFPNRVTDSWGFVGGGSNNTAGNDNASHDDAAYSVVGGGRTNDASGWASTVGGGIGNRAGGEASAVPGGDGNSANGDGAFAAGTFARANAVGCFVWADRTPTTKAAVQCDDPGLFLARALGGFRLHTNFALSTGCTIAAGGGAWSCSSARALKDDFAAVDAAQVLDRVVAMPIATWRYKDEASGARHMGPTAEDFHAAFGLGDSSSSIGMLDGPGVALAAIQGLNARVEAQAREIAALKAALAATLERLAK